MRAAQNEHILGNTGAHRELCCYVAVLSCRMLCCRWCLDACCYDVCCPVMECVPGGGTFSASKQIMLSKYQRKLLLPEEEMSVSLVLETHFEGARHSELIIVRNTESVSFLPRKFIV